MRSLLIDHLSDETMISSLGEQSMNIKFHHLRLEIYFIYIYIYMYMKNKTSNYLVLSKYNKIKDSIEVS